MKVYEGGVHRLPVGGIQGSEKEGAYSIVFSEKYKTNDDKGDDMNH